MAERNGDKDNDYDNDKERDVRSPPHLRGLHAQGKATGCRVGVINQGGGERERVDFLSRRTMHSPRLTRGNLENHPRAGPGPE